MKQIEIGGNVYNLAFNFAALLLWEQKKGHAITEDLERFRESLEQNRITDTLELAQVEMEVNNPDLPVPALFDIANAFKSIKDGFEFMSELIVDMLHEFSGDAMTPEAEAGKEKKPKKR